VANARWQHGRAIANMPDMNAQNPRHMEFGLVRDMLASVDALRNFDPAVIEPIVEPVRTAGRLMLTGEGSSRIFPAKNAISHSLRRGDDLQLATEAATQAAEYDLTRFAVCGVSNSGRTAEVIRLFQKLKGAGHQRLFSITAHAGSTLESLATRAFTLKCGGESAVAATKSVLEQALHHRALVDAVARKPLGRNRLAQLADHVQTALTTEIDPALVDRIAAAGTIYWAGRNDGVAEELTLKTNEITRKPADYLPGTYAAHGVEEVMHSTDVVLWVNPFADAEAKFGDVLAKGVGLTIIAIAPRPTAFPTILIPDAGDLAGYVEMAAGWNVLVEAGLRLGINLDKPQRARKVGNEFTG
jgi:glutamine---fructose-6-phosphate transaminase (isomerizing)